MDQVIQTPIEADATVDVEADSELDFDRETLNDYLALSHRS
jgi:hypothetical protein